MKNVNQFIENAKQAYNETPLFSMEEMEGIYSNTPSVDIGMINLKANFFRRHIMKFLSVAAVGILVTTFYLLSTEADQKELPTMLSSSDGQIQNISNNQSASEAKSQSEGSNIQAPEFDMSDISNQDNNLFAAMSNGISSLFDDDETTSKQQSTLMGYPIMILSKQEAQNIGFIYEDDEIIYRHKARIDLPFENIYASKEDYDEALRYYSKRFEDKGYNIKSDSIVYEQITIGSDDDSPAHLEIIDKSDVIGMQISNINAISLNHFQIKNTFFDDYSAKMVVTLSPPFQLSKYMSDDYLRKISLYKTNQIIGKKLYEDYSHFYVDTSYKSSEVFKKFVKIIIPIDNDDATILLEGWFLLNKELASKLPKRYQADIAHKYQITDCDYFTDSGKQIAIFLDEDAKLPWTKISFIPNHFPIYGTKSNGIIEQIDPSGLSKISAYLSKKLPNRILKNLSKNLEKNISLLNSIASNNNAVKLLLTILKEDKTKCTNINALELDITELNKLNICKSENRISFFVEYINEDDEIVTRENLYQFGYERQEEIEGYKLFNGGTYSNEHFRFSYKNATTTKKLHNFNPLMPTAYSVNSDFTFYNSPNLYYTKDMTIKHLYKKQDYYGFDSKHINSDINLPIYVHDGDDFEMIGSKPESYVPYLSMLDRLIPIKMETGFKNIPGPVYLWYLPTTEFLNALPERYSKSIRKELAILDKIENQNVEPEKACKGFDEESFFGICDLSSGALSNIKIAPNPCMFDLNISFTATDTRSVNIEIFDINGRAVKTLGNYKLTNFGEQNYDFDISSLKTGVYQLVIISDQGEKISKRFIKQ